MFWLVSNKSVKNSIILFLLKPTNYFSPTLLAIEIKTTETVGPVLLHVVTEKGRGYLPAETASDKMHGVTQYDTITGQQVKPKTKVRITCSFITVWYLKN